MPRHWSVVLRCEHCFAVVVYQNQRPRWRYTEPVREWVEAAERYIQEHPKGSLFTSLPPYVSHDAITTENAVTVPPIRRYVVCPACDGAAWPLDTTDHAEREPGGD
jgi:hypothetical protein